MTEFGTIEIILISLVFLAILYFSIRLAVRAYYDERHNYHLKLLKTLKQSEDEKHKNQNV